MTYHAVLWLDHQVAHVLQFDESHIEVQRIKARSHHTRQHGSDQRHEREFYESITAALTGVHEILVVGPGQAGKDFRKHCETHDKGVAQAIVDVQAADHPTDDQLVAQARKYFLKYDQMAGDPAL
jgi:stalled ribosome rescue protein Dom34